MKVEEAQKKFCPFMQPNYNPTHFGQPNDPYACKCVTDKCMAWGWNQVPMPLTEEEKAQFDVVMSRRYETSTTEGYCKRIGQ